MSLPLYSDPDGQFRQAVGVPAGAETDGFGSVHRITRSTAENADQRPVPSRPSIQFTEVTSIRPSRLSKGFKLNGAGDLVSEQGGQMSEGSGTRVAVPSIVEFAERQQQLDTSQALIFGVPDRETVRIVTKSRRAAMPDRPDDVIARDAESFAWPAGPGILIPCGTEPLPGVLGGSVADERGWRS